MKTRREQKKAHGTEAIYPEIGTGLSPLEKAYKAFKYKIFTTLVLFVLGGISSRNFINAATPTSHFTSPSKTAPIPPPAELTAPQRLQAAETARTQRLWKIASDHYATFLRDFGDHPSAKGAASAVRVRLLESQLQCDDPAAALGTLETLLQTDPANPPKTVPAFGDLLLLKGKLALRLSRFPIARSCFEQWLQTHPPKPPTSLTRHHPSAVHSHPEQPQKPTHPEAEALLGLSASLLGENRPKDAARILDQNAPRFLHPQSLHTARLLRIRCALAAQAPEEAYAFLETHLSALRLPEFESVCDALLWETAEALIQKNNSESLGCALLCLQRLASPSQQNAVRHPPEGILIPPTANLAQSNIQPVPPQGNTPHQTSSYPPSNASPAEWRRLTRIAYVLERMGRTADCPAVLECAKQHAPDPAQREALEIQRLQLLEKLQRWPELESGAHEFLLLSTRDAKDAVYSRVLFLRATAESEQAAYEKACKTLEQIESARPQSPDAAHARLLHAHNLLLSNRPTECLAQIDHFETLHRSGPLHSLALSLRSQAFFQKKAYDACLKTGEQYAHRFPDGEHLGCVRMYCALAAYAKGDFSSAIQYAQSCLSARPEPEIANQTLLILGQALARLHRKNEALEAFHRIGSAPDTTTDTTAEAAIREIAHVLHSSGDTGSLRQFWEKTLREHPRSESLVEMTRWVIENVRKAPAPDTAESLLGFALGELCSISRCEAALPLMDMLQRELSKRGSNNGLETVLKKRSFPSERPYGAALLRLHSLCEKLNAQPPVDREKTLQVAVPLALENLEHSPANLLALLAESCGNGLLEEASKDLQNSEAGPSPNTCDAGERSLLLWRELVRWNPKAPQKDKAHLAIGLHATRRGDLPAASDSFGRALRECPNSPLIGRIRLERARILLEVNSMEDAETDLHAVLASNASPARIKAEALVLLGEKHMRASAPHKAIACFQRVYILYPSCENAVASAYLRSGEAFEALEDAAAARRTYAELLSRTRLQPLPQYESARRKLQNLPP